MIAQLSGHLVQKDPTYLVLDIGGVGYGVHISLYTFEQVKPLKTCTIFTAMQVRNEHCLLYGFYSLEERQWWKRLIGVSGIGPKVALTILSSLAPEVLQKAIIEKNEILLASIKGIGKKAAQRMTLELANKIDELSLAHSHGVGRKSADQKMYQDGIKALTKLGFTQKLAEEAILLAQKEADGPVSLESLIKTALQPVSSK